MAGLGIKLFTDEMVSPQLAHRLVRQFYDVVCCRDRGRSNKKIPDSEQIKYATQDDRAILTYNPTEYAAIHQTWLATGNGHSGIIISDQIDDIAELERRVKRHLDTVHPGDQYNRLLVLR
jgi:hypothetical protein